jgi:anti-anti-sigma regulatory factor
MGSPAGGSPVQIRPLGGLRVVGEVDITARPDWSATLAALAGQDADIHLDMAELTFIDTHATAELVELARTLPAGRTITLCRPPRVLRRVMDVIWSQAPSSIRVLS